MAEDSPFRYFAEPHRYSTYETQPSRCDICGESRAGFADAFYSDADGPDIRFVCEADLAAGRLSEAGARSNTADRFAIELQTAALHPHWSAAQFDEYCESRIREIEVCTPSIPMWQESEWPVHCAEFMRYLREIGREDCEKLAGGDGGLAFLTRYLFRDQEAEDQPTAADFADLWSVMRADSPMDSSAPTDNSFYLFQCVVCSEYLIGWDFDSATAVGTDDEG